MVIIPIYTDLYSVSKQAFEDGLLDFFTRGIMECESLGDAFRNLAVTVLEAINRMYAEALVKNIMGALFPAPDTPKMPGIGSTSGGSKSSYDTNFGYDFDSSTWWKNKYADGGPVVGPGTGTSDSILAALSNGEFVINAAAVKQVGIDALHRINSGRAFQLPMPKFAMGGLVGDGSGIQSIPQFAAETMASGMDNFSANVGVNASPTINNNTTVKIDGDGLAERFRGLIKADVTSHFETYIKNNAKFISKVVGMVGGFRGR